MGVYHVAAGSGDRERDKPQDRDEVYVAIEGKACLTAAGEQHTVEPGAVIYVKTGVEHFFHDVAEDLTVLVFFAGSKCS